MWRVCHCNRCWQSKYVVIINNNDDSVIILFVCFAFFELDLSSSLRLNAVGPAINGVGCQFAISAVGVRSRLLSLVVVSL